MNKDMIQPKLFEKKTTKVDQNRKQDSNEADSNECSLD